MEEQVTVKQRLVEEIEQLNDDEVAEVLEYISIMRSMKEEESNPQRFEDELRILLSQPEEGVASSAPEAGEKRADRSRNRSPRFAS